MGENTLHYVKRIVAGQTSFCWVLSMVMTTLLKSLLVIFTDILYHEK